MEPVGPRSADAVTGAFKLGNEFAWRHNAPDVGTDLHLISTEPPGDYAAWAYYEFADTGMQPLALTVNGQYIDPNPHEDLPDEGYWIAYADYAKGRWVYSGPHRQGQARAFIPSTANLVSPGGFIYALVLTWGGAEAMLKSVQIGYDAGFGYEESWLATPQGVAVGNRCDIQLDAAGQPQIAYLRSERVAFSNSGKARVAVRGLLGWEVTAIPTSFDVSVVRLALGDGGCRALLLLEDEWTSPELWLYYDPGTGDFTEQHQVSAIAEPDCLPGVTFVNSADNPAGDLDLALMTYANTAAGGQQTTVYRTFDGVVLSPEQSLHIDKTTAGGTLSLSTRANKTALVGVADDTGGWRYYVGTCALTAPPPHWDFSAITSWVCGSDVDASDDFAPDFALRELPGGDFVASYRSDGEVVLARWDGTNWLQNERDSHPLSTTEIMDMEVYSDDYVGIAGNYGFLAPVLHRGQVAVGSMTWDTHYLDGLTEPRLSLALAVGGDDTSHLAAFSMNDFTIDYITRTMGGDVAVEKVDVGGMMQGYTTGQVEVVAVDDQVHVFYVDGAHLWPMHAVNVGGVWVKDGEIIAKDSGAYYFAGAGYLESSGMLYCAWWDVLDGSVLVASATGDMSEWEVVSFCPTVFSPFAFVADNEVDIGVLTMNVNMGLGDGTIVFCQGPPREGTTIFEDLGSAEGVMGEHWHLAYNHGDGTWGALITDSSEQRTRYYRRNVDGTWLGPSTVLQRDGSGKAVGAGLCYRASDGAARVLVRQRVDTSNLNYLTIFSAPQGSMNFSFVSSFASVDTAVEKLGVLGFAASLEGEPIAYLGHKLLADTVYDVEIFTPSGVDTWASTNIWEDAYEASSMVGTAITPAGLPVAAVCEMADGAPHENSIGVYYPW
jgi:hypothetical protein